MRLFEVMKRRGRGKVSEKKGKICEVSCHNRVGERASLTMVNNCENCPLTLNP